MRKRKQNNKEHIINSMIDNTNTKDIRIPRPIGTTMISKAHSTQNKENNESYNQSLYNLQSHIIKSYINNNYRYNNIPYTIEQFSSITNIPQSLILESIYDIQQIQYNLLDEKGKGDILRVLEKGIFWGFLESQQAITHHAQTLLRDQAGSYKPFISSEVTKALKLQLDTLQLGLNMQQRFNPNPGSSTAINIYNQNQQNVLSVSEAQALINNDKTTAPLLENKEAKDKLFLEYDVADMPVVNATLQVGVDSSREGISFQNMNQELKEPHTDRRAKELNIDLDSDNI